MKKRPLRLTEEHHLTICLALRGEYERCMTFLNLHGPNAGHFLTHAGKAWDTYKAFTGFPMHGAP